MHPSGSRAPERFRGVLIAPSDSGYDAARGLFNERVEERPRLIARCAGVADVQAALALARERELEVAVRGGGHSVAGWSTTTGGLVIDLTLMRDVHVDAATATAWVGGGSLAVDVIAEAGEYGLAPVTGVSPGVGVAGLVLGLGEGYLTARHGFGADNVVAIELVTADGTVLRVSADERPDLFWAMRGAGANFGVVTALELRLHPAPERAVGGWIEFGERDAAHVTRQVWEIMRVGGECFFPLALYDLDDAGAVRIRIIPGHTGPAALADREIGELRRCGKPASDELRTMSYRDLVHEIAGSDDDITGRPARRVWDIRRFPFDRPAERQIELLLAQTRALSPAAHFNLWRTVTPPPPSPPGAAPRLQGISVFLSSHWSDAADDARELRWVREAAAALDGSGLVGEAANAVNHTSFFDELRARRLYGDAAYDRLASLKAKYDPGNLFHRNANIPPAR